MNKQKAIANKNDSIKNIMKRKAHESSSIVS